MILLFEQPLDSIIISFLFDVPDVPVVHGHTIHLVSLSLEGGGTPKARALGKAGNSK
jgi:hypothetical protein